MIVTAPHPVHCSGSYYAVRHKGQPQQPRFSGVSDMLVTVFQPITEQFIYGFLAQDVVALWIPRIINALRRGRTPYDYREDPDIRDKHPLQQWLHSVYMNAKGLNYPNGIEESLREIETGPGVLITKSAIMAAGGALLLGKLGLQMGTFDLNAFHHSFVTTMGNPANYRLFRRNISPEELFQRFIQAQLFEHHFKHAGKATLKPLARLAYTNPADTALKTFLQKHFPNKPIGRVTYEEALKAWIGEFGKHKDHNTVFERLVHYYNEAAEVVDQTGRRLKTKVLDPSKLNKVEFLHMGDHPHAHKGVLQLSAGEYLEHLRKFKTVVQDIRNYALNKHGYQASRRAYQKNIVEAAGDVVRSAIRNKFWLFGIVATILAGATVVLISAIAQRGKTYPANNYLPLDMLEASGGGATQNRQQTVQRNGKPVYAGTLYANGPRLSGPFAQQGLANPFSPVVAGGGASR